ncbi:uncharacterized protein MONOS_14761 [Monocercomonoides exilis]|uniref:uncharacterized protein n=1 Tax=Monocercomonoides exilis TaxID=2049356 RepID=UPI003559E6E6|nr:hypothetical protein MONOS_14761 [Monocercomonoides exilis]|eukprot:MONOS_14761.1-p1 / transcript=MONOS_14761.1 / gene=MONOS_14761 / organism=Monocercomonoides_exilis_PA203 / gene_product=unspecified product / transcript_product=unspecified product / location=Mono_scaffold01065:14613-14936(-) / protein_length=108 / sequence_SO=supercontig / SO=protein_coding / is_pseudo=false
MDDDSSYDPTNASNLENFCDNDDDEDDEDEKDEEEEEEDDDEKKEDEEEEEDDNDEDNSLRKKRKRKYSTKQLSLSNIETHGIHMCKENTEFYIEQRLKTMKQKYER